jgi:hypothetical protein
MDAGDRKIVFEEKSQVVGGYLEHGNPTERIFEGIISRLKEEATTSVSIPGKIVVSFPVGEKASEWKNKGVSITGVASFDLFDHHEFGRLEPRLELDRESSVTAHGTTLTMHWPENKSPSRYIVFLHRHIAANFGSNYHELRSRWNRMVIPWYFVFRDQTHNTYWEDMKGQNIEYCGGSSFCALHVGRSRAILPPGVKADEVIVYASRYLGSVQCELMMNDITLLQKD